MIDLVVRKNLILKRDGTKPKVLAEDSAAGLYLAYAQRTGFVRCKASDAGAVPVLVGHPDPTPGDDDMVTQYWKLKDGYQIGFAKEMYRGARQIVLLQPRDEWLADRDVGLRRRAKREKWSEEKLAERLSKTGPGRREARLTMED